MKKRQLALSFFLSVVFSAGSLLAQWKTISPAVDYAEFTPRPPFTYHVTRVDLTDRSAAVVVSSESDRGRTVSKFAAARHAIAAVNGDYFDEKLQPIGLTSGACGKWSARGTSGRKETLAAFGDGRAVILDGSEAQKGIPAWADYAVSGWPMLVRDCRALTSSELPGSDSFTRAPHARTAIGLSRDNKTLYIVVADGVKEKSVGVTLPELAAFMDAQLGVCTAMNLDGGGSSAMSVRGRLMTTPAGESERPVANHLAVVAKGDIPSCDSGNAPAPGVVANADFWNDVREIVGSGTADGSLFRISVERDQPQLFGTVRMQRLKSGVYVSGVVPMLDSESTEARNALSSAGLSMEDLASGGPTQWAVIAGKASSTDAAHAIRKLFDALELSMSPSRRSAVPAALSPVSSVFGSAAAGWSAGMRVTRPVSFTLKTTSGALPGELGSSELFFQPSGDGVSVTGVLLVPAATAGTSKTSLASAGLEVVDAAPWPGTPRYRVLSIAGKGDAAALAAAIAKALR